jgi:hypothetical protein
MILLLSAALIGCSRKPPYDAKVIDESELDSPAQKERTAPAAGGGKALSDRQW